MNQTQAALVMVLGAIAVLALMWWGGKTDNSGPRL